MLLQRSKLAAGTAERPRLASPWSIALLGTMLLTVLAAIYPHQTLVRRVIEAPTNELTEAYLTNLLRTDAENPELRLVLARNQLQAGLYDRVRKTLEPALSVNSAHTRQKAIWLIWQSEEARYRRLPADSPLRAEALRGLRIQLAEIAGEEWDDHALAEIARKALAFGDTRLGLSLMTRLAERNDGQDTRWYAEAAEVALASAEYRAAAEFYLIAGERALTLAEQRRHFLQAMRTMQSGNLIPEALAMAERQLASHAALANDGEILELLVRFARAARRPDLADKYARRLLRLSLLEQLRRERLAASGFDAAPRRVALNGQATGTAAPSGPQVPFDDRIYTLGYEAFLDNRNLEDAWKVAVSAVRQAPDSPVWRKRLAQVSEWTGRPQIALEHWEHLAHNTGSSEAWQAVLRLAPGLFDDRALRAALQHQLTRQPDDARLWAELLAVYERLGDPQGAMRFLEQTYARTRQPSLLEQMAELAQRAGDDDLALRYWQRFIDAAGVTPARAVRVATLLLLRARPDDALTLLERAQGEARPEDIAFWRLTAELAQAARKDASAIDAYRRLTGHADAEERDYEALRQLLQPGFPLEAAQVASAAWRRFGDPAQFVYALGHFAVSERWPEMGRLLGELDASQRDAMRQKPEFLQLAAQYHLQGGARERARQYLETAVRLAPENTDIRNALLWLLIDGNDSDALRNLLATHESDWQKVPGLHDALGAAYLALSLPEVALRHYYTPRLAEHRDDFLWLMNYADALEQNQESERAWQLRETLLADAGRRQMAPEAPSTENLDRLRRAALTRLQLSQRQGDAGLSALRELLRLDHGSREAWRELSPAARDVALAWFQERGEHSAARGWLWQQYARLASRPAWAEVALALAERDREAAGRLLERRGANLAPQGRISLAGEIGDLSLVQSEAFDVQDRQQADDPLHLQLSDALLAHSDHAGGAYVRRELGTLVETDASAHLHLALSPRLALDLTAGRIARSDLDTTAVGVAPDETYRSIRLGWRDADGETRLSVEDRHSFSGYTPVLLEREQRIDNRLSLNLALGIQQPANESVALSVAGLKDRASIGLNYQPDRSSRLSIGYLRDDFSTQTGTAIGHGKTWQIEATHALRSEARSLEASAFWSDHRFSRCENRNIFDARLNRLLPAGIESATDLGADFFLPEDFRFYGIRLSTDTRFERDYTRTWRPFATIARTWHSQLGPGYDLAAGIAGSVFGGDHLSLGWKLGKSGSTTGGHVREIGLTYRIHY